MVVGLSVIVIRNRGVVVVYLGIEENSEKHTVIVRPPLTLSKHKKIDC